MSTPEFIKITIVAGIMATTVMTMFVILIGWLTRKRLNVIRILGTMLTSQTLPDGECSTSLTAVFIGLIAHYGVGFFFTAIYISLWSHEILPIDTFTTSTIGLISGIIGIAVWRAYFSLHKHPPLVPMKLYLTTILFAHVLFALADSWWYLQLI
jgi:hypothetical protein